MKRFTIEVNGTGTTEQLIHHLQLLINGLGGDIHVVEKGKIAYEDKVLSVTITEQK